MLLLNTLLAAATCVLATSAPVHMPFKSLHARNTTSPLPTSFNWTSTGPLIFPKDDGRNVSGIKDPSIVFINGTYHVFASTAQEAGYSLVYLNFTDFSAANSSTFYYLDQTAIGTGYRAAPEVFFFTPHNLWYLIYQNGNAAYSTNPDISDVSGWTAPANFYAAEPEIIVENIGNGYWVDMWTICDADNCYLFSSDDNGHLYRSSTTLAAFPDGMSEPVIAKTADLGIYSLYEASCIYHIAGAATPTYVLIVEAIGGDGNRYFRSWTSDTIAGNWTGLADTEANPFARSNNVAFPDGAWTQSISHGEVVRTMTDQTLSIEPCGLKFLYQGMDPMYVNLTYNALPWRLALITEVGNEC